MFSAGNSHAKGGTPQKGGMAMSCKPLADMARRSTVACYIQSLQQVARGILRDPPRQQWQGDQLRRCFYKHTMKDHAAEPFSAGNSDILHVERHLHVRSAKLLTSTEVAGNSTGRLLQKATANDHPAPFSAGKGVSAGLLANPQLSTSVLYRP